jgi:hypothetical protein
LTNKAISTPLGVGEATIYRDNQVLRQLAVSRATNLDIKEEIGEALNFLDDLADKAMEGYRSAVEDNEQVFYEMSASGEKTEVRRSAPDHSQANRYLMTAATAKKQKVDTILQVSTTHAVNKTLLNKAEEFKDHDIATLRAAEEFEKPWTPRKNRKNIDQDR